MTQHDPNLRLRHMLAHGREALALVRDFDQSRFEQDRVIQLASVRLLEIIGEAAARTPAEERDQHPAIPRRRISSMRNRHIHGYDAVDLAIVWSVLDEDLPELVAQLESIVVDLGQ
jgi:uncharacterized protein with HEPN domain